MRIKPESHKITSISITLDSVDEIELFKKILIECLSYSWTPTFRGKAERPEAVAAEDLLRRINDVTN